MSNEKDAHIIGWENRFADSFGENTRGADKVTKSGRDKKMLLGEEITVVFVETN